MWNYNINKQKSNARARTNEGNHSSELRKPLKDYLNLIFIFDKYSIFFEKFVHQ